MKTFRCSEVLEFSLPDHWVAEEVEDGATIFYEHGDESSTLHLQLLALDPAGQEAADPAFEALLSIDGVSPDGIERLAERKYIVTSNEEFVESGIRVTAVRWRLAAGDHSGPTYLFLFSFSFPSKLRESRETLAILGMIDAEIRNSRINRI